MNKAPVGSGEWGVECGEWGVECGVWAVGCGVWAVGSGVWGVQKSRVWGVGCSEEKIRNKEFRVGTEEVGREK